MPDGRMLMSAKIRLSRESKFFVEFHPALFAKEPKTDMTVYRYGQGNTITGMTLKEMRYLRNAINRELDRQADEAMDERDEYKAEYIGEDDE